MGFIYQQTSLRGTTFYKSQLKHSPFFGVTFAGDIDQGNAKFGGQVGRFLAGDVENAPGFNGI